MLSITLGSGRHAGIESEHSYVRQASCRSGLTIPRRDDATTDRGQSAMKRQGRDRRWPHIGRALPRVVAEARWARWALVSALVLAWLALPPSSAAAQESPDSAALEQISKVIEGPYSRKRYTLAEESLLEVITNCENGCRPGTLARAWMYVGVVQGNGLGDQRAAREAFEKALGLDPEIALDTARSTPETLTTFEAARHGTQRRNQSRPQIGAPSAGSMAPKPAASPVKPVRRGLSCTPSGGEIQTRRPIPFDCHTDEETERVSVRYRELSDAPWQTLELEPEGSSFRATLPCEVTMNSGRLQLFIVATDAAGDPLDTLGSKSAPLELVLNPESNVTPAYPGEAPPDRCQERVLCPPDFPGCADADQEDAGVATRGQLRPRHWVSVHFAVDVGFLGGSNVCTSNNLDYDCFDSDSDAAFPGALPADVAARPGELGDGYPGTELSSGPALGTLRALLGYDHALNDRVSVGGRVGYAFRGGPTTLEGRSFLPLHLEARLAYWPRGSWASGLRPYLQLGAGLAEVDIVQRKVAVQDCTTEPGRQAFLNCIAALDAYAPASSPELPSRTLDVYRKLGNAFASVGGGLAVPLGARASLLVNLQAMLMLPSVGVVLQPSLGVAYGL
jgi:hypothetical protein